MRKTVLLYPAVRLTALLLSVCFLLTSVFPCITYAGNSDNGPAITSPAAILMEASTGQVIYEKDTINHWKTVTEPGVQQIRLFADTLGSMKEIKGFIYYPMDSQEKGGAVLADRFMMTRYHCTDTLAFAVRDSLNKIEALKAAREKASYLVEAMGQKLGEVIRIVEPASSYVSPYSLYQAQSNVSMGTAATEQYRVIKLRYEMTARFAIE